MLRVGLPRCVCTGIVCMRCDVVTLAFPSGRRAGGGVCGACAIGAVFRKVPDEISAKCGKLDSWNTCPGSLMHA